MLLVVFVNFLGSHDDLPTTIEAIGRYMMTTMCLASYRID
jgi:hypothetical protein